MLHVLCVIKAGGLCVAACSDCGMLLTDVDRKMVVPVDLLSGAVSRFWRILYFLLPPSHAFSGVSTKCKEILQTITLEGDL